MTVIILVASLLNRFVIGNVCRRCFFVLIVIVVVIELVVVSMCRRRRLGCVLVVVPRVILLAVFVGKAHGRKRIHKGFRR